MPRKIENVTTTKELLHEQLPPPQLLHQLVGPLTAIALVLLALGSACRVAQQKSNRRPGSFMKSSTIQLVKNESSHFLLHDNCPTELVLFVHPPVTQLLQLPRLPTPSSRPSLRAKAFRAGLPGQNCSPCL